MADATVVNAATIGVVLPARETFTLKKSGAVALCSRDFARFSRFASGIEILGAGVCEYPDVRYVRLTRWRHLGLRQRDAYTRAVIREAKARGHAMLEVQNRPYMIPELRAKLPGVTLALHLHNDPRTMDGSASARERRELLAHLDAVYCVSGFIRRCFLEEVADPEGKVRVVYNGVEATPPRAPKERVFAFVGRVIEVKGVVELIKAYARAAPEGWRLIVAGDDPAGLVSGPNSRVKAEVAALGDRLALLGQVSHAEAMALFARAEVAVVPSLWEEPCGRSAIEGMASGCALVATARGGLAEVVDGAGVVVEPEDNEGFAAALRSLAADDEGRRALQAKAAAKARDIFDIRAVTAVLDASRAALL